jgi:hypothetical protein
MTVSRALATWSKWPPQRFTKPSHALRDNDRVAGIPEGLAAVRVSVTSIPIEHTVKMQDFTNWVERKGGSPREVSHRDRIRAILGLPR